MKSKSMRLKRYVRGNSLPATKEYVRCNLDSYVREVVGVETKSKPSAHRKSFHVALVGI